jgi:ice-binding like protein
MSKLVTRRLPPFQLLPLPSPGPRAHDVRLLLIVSLCSFLFLPARAFALDAPFLADATISIDNGPSAPLAVPIGPAEPGTGSAPLAATHGAATITSAASVPPSLGAAQSFAVLGGTAVTAAGTGSVITGDVGVSPGTAITGFPASATVVLPFAIHSNDSFASSAQDAAGSLYADLVAAGPCSPLAPQLDGVTVTPGIYCFAATADVAATGTLTLDGAGRYIFQVGSALSANVLSTVTLLHGADPCNVFWQVTSAATLNGFNFAGTVVAQANVTVGVGSSLTGRALTTVAGAVTLSGTNTVGGCSAAVSATPTPTATPGEATSTPTRTSTPIAATPTPISCVGDCNGNGSVTIDELIKGVNIILETQPLTACPQFDANDSGTVSVNELIMGINNALGHCPG